MRFITGATARSSIVSLYQETCFLTIGARCNIAKLIMFYKMKSGAAPTYLDRLIPPDNDAIHNYNLRNKGDVIKPKRRLTTFSRSFLPSVIDI